MSRVVFLAAKALEAALETETVLTGRVEVLQQLPDLLAAYPKVVIMPERFKFEPALDEEVPDDDGAPVMVGDLAMMEVGHLAGSVRIWAGANHPPQREDIEDAIFRAFCREELAPGRLLVELTDVSVGGVATGADWPVAFQIDGAEWHEELVFSEKRWSFLRADVDVPVFVMRSAPLVQDMVIALTADLETQIGAPADLALIRLEQIAVDEDGALSTFP